MDLTQIESQAMLLSLQDRATLADRLLLTLKKTPIDKPWIGEQYEKSRILVLGESGYGNWGDNRNSDQGYITAYLLNQIVDKMYTKMSNSCGMDKETYWQSIAFTNFVLWVGNNNKDRPTITMYKNACPRLSELLKTLQPAAVWILGKGQSEYSAPVIHQANIPYEVVNHPTALGTTSLMLTESWQRLMVKLNHTS